MSITGTAIACDTIMFKVLIEYSNYENISEKEFLICKDLVDTLWSQGCDDFVRRINNQNVAITSLTYTYGKICYIANSELATKSYIEYLLKNKNSAEEQLSFSFENLFTQKPYFILQEISKLNLDDQNQLLREIAWGFVNNRSHGILDPYDSNPYKAFTFYEHPPKRILDSINYKEIFYMVNPTIHDIDNEFPKMIDTILEYVYYMIKFDDMMRKKYQ